jgi:NAD(P)-dependent dehydrogenase (short-subunit alcohol dehydrogenase family)
MISGYREKIKPFWERYGEPVVTVGFVVLVGIGSFFFGSAFGYQKAQVLTKQIDNVVVNNQAVPLKAPFEEFSRPSANTSIQTETKQGGPFMASVSGTKYYPSSGCGATNRIKPENVVYFGSAEEAEEKGYERYSGCK